MIVTTRAQVSTQRAGRYAKQLVVHMTRKTTGEWDDEAGVGHLLFGESRLELLSAPEHLELNLDAPDADLDRLEQVIGIHLARFGAKDELVVAWERADGTPGTKQVKPSE